MAELLQFKRGLHANLPASYAPGTIYVTTDEQAMYVDVSVTENDSVVNKRIRLGDIIQVESYAEWQKMAPPYSRTALYYIVEQNALIKYTGDGTTHTWKQINSTSTLSANLEALTARVAANETSIAVNTADIKELDEAIYGTLNGEQRAEDGLVHSIAANEAAIALLNAAVAEKVEISVYEEFLEGYEAHLTAQSEKDTAQDSAIAANTAAVATKAEQADLTALTGRVGTNEQEITNLKTALDGKASASEFNNLSTTVGNLSTTVDGHGTALTELNGTVAGHTTQLENVNIALAGKADAATVTELSGKVDKNASDILLKADAATVTALSGRVDNQETQLTGLNTKVNNQGTAISNLQTTVGDETTGLVKAVAENATKIGEIEEELKSLATEDTVNDLTERVGALESIDASTRLTTLETGVTTLQSTKADKSVVEELTAEVATKAAQADLQNAQDDIADLEEIVNGADGQSGLVKDVADNKISIDANASAITTLQQALNGSGDNAGLVSRLEAVETKATNNATAIGENADAIEENALAIQNTNSAVSGLDTRVGANEQAIAALQTAVATKAEQTAVDAAIEDVKSYVDQQMTTADAMEFIGSVASYSDLPTTGVEKGHTYVVTSTFAQDGVTYFAGDMLIASADQGEEETYTGGWTHVETGYIQEHEAKLSGNDNKILLTSHTSVNTPGDLGAITFTAAEDTSATVSVANNTVTIGMAWGSF